MAETELKQKPSVRNWDTAEETLRQIGELTRLLKVKNMRAQTEIEEIKAGNKKETEGIQAEIKLLKKALKSFSDRERKRTGFLSKRTLYGLITYRRSTSLKTLKGFTWDRVIELLREKRFSQFLRIKHSVDKEALKLSKLSTEKLAELGVFRKTERPFDYKLDEEKFADSTATEAPAQRAASA